MFLPSLDVEFAMVSQRKAQTLLEQIDGIKESVNSDGYLFFFCLHFH